MKRGAHVTGLCPRLLPSRVSSFPSPPSSVFACLSPHAPALPSVFSPLRRRLWLNFDPCFTLKFLFCLIYLSLISQACAHSDCLAFSLSFFTFPRPTPTRFPPPSYFVPKAGLPAKAAFIGLFANDLAIGGPSAPATKEEYEEASGARTGGRLGGRKGKKGRATLVSSLCL
jgi:hypothetical protein